MDVRPQVPNKPDDFGQETNHTCNLACFRFVLWCYGINHTEKQLLRNRSNRRGVIREYKNGNTPQEVAQAASQLGFIPCLRCLTGHSQILGKPSERWVQEGSEDELKQWLRDVVGKQQKPVIVAVHTGRLGLPYDRGGLHSIAVIKVEGNRVTYLETDSPQQGKYPKRGQYMSADFGTFLDAWRAVACAALLITCTSH